MVWSGRDRRCFIGHLEGGTTIVRGLTITMVINHLLTGMILQVVAVQFSKQNTGI